MDTFFDRYMPVLVVLAVLAPVCGVGLWRVAGLTEPQNPFQVTKLFSVETCNVYRFKDGWFNTQYLVECERGSKALGPVKYYDPNTHELKGKKP